MDACWPRNQCSECLRLEGCGWCPWSNTCVPAPHRLLSPLFHPVCPLAGERLELRCALGCKVSLQTVLVVVSVLAAVLLVHGLCRLLPLVLRFRRFLRAVYRSRRRRRELLLLGSGG